MAAVYCWALGTLASSQPRPPLSCSLMGTRRRTHPPTGPCPGHHSAILSVVLRGAES